MESKTTTTRTLAANTTSAPVEAGDVASVQPEFCRPSDCRKLFGLGRSYTYTLIASGAIRSTCLRQRGKRTGLRLIDVASVRSFLQNQFTTDANG